MNTINTALVFVIPLLVLAIVLALYRLLSGPSAADRVVALDVMASYAVGVVAVESIALGNPIFIDAALIIALVAFLGTVGFAYYLQRQAAK